MLTGEGFRISQGNTCLLTSISEGLPAITRLDVAVLKGFLHVLYIRMLEVTRDVGVDESGIGCWLGDVVAAAVIMPDSYPDDDKLVHLIKDSKKCTAKRRAQLAEYIKSTALTYGIGTASVAEIDKYNILNAKFMAMHRALDAAHEKMPFDSIVVDGDKFLPYNKVPHRCLVGGDNILLNIAAASILAKTHRDHMVNDLLLEHPEWKDQYSFHTNMGYGTKAHMDGLKKFGATAQHRTSYAPVKPYACGATPESPLCVV